LPMNVRTLTLQSTYTRLLTFDIFWQTLNLNQCCCLRTLKPKA
jgi:hypothetical protein